MRKQRNLLAAALILSLTLGCAGNVSAAPTQTEQDYIRQMVSYYYHYTDTAVTDIARVSEQLATIDPWLAETWLALIDGWAHINRDLPIDTDTLPEGLPNDDSLCIVVLGYQLAADGSIRRELSGRMEVARKAAEQYPNAYILVTGGATAANASVTEAGQMASWLTGRGIDRSRIIIEDRSHSTTQNAIFSCEILRRDYPQICSIAMVTSDYHIRRGSVCFYTDSLMNGEVPYEIVASAAYQTEHSSENILLQIDEIERITGVNLNHLPKPTLSRLTGLTVAGQTAYEAGEALAITVTAHYDSDYSRDVTALAEFSEVDMQKAGTQTLSVKYREGGREAAQSVTIAITGKDTVQKAIEKLLIYVGHDPEKAADLSLTTARFAPLILFAVLIPALAGIGAVARRILPKKKGKRKNPLRE